MLTQVWSSDVHTHFSSSFSSSSFQSLTASSDMRKARHAFSSFLGKLFISSNYTRNEEWVCLSCVSIIFCFCLGSSPSTIFCLVLSWICRYNAAVGHAVRHFLNIWSRCSHQVCWLSPLATPCYSYHPWQPLAPPSNPLLPLSPLAIPCHPLAISCCP